MSRLLFLSVVGVVTVLSCADTVDAQRFRNRNNDCSCQPNVQQNYQANAQQNYRANYQRYRANYQRYQANYRPNYQAVAARQNYVPVQQVPAGYYQQNAMLNYGMSRNPRMRYQPVPQAQVRPAVQYSATRGCWMPVPNANAQSQYGLVPARPSPVAQGSAAANSYQVAPTIANEQANIQQATFDEPVEASTPPLSAPESNPVAESIPITDRPATSILENGN